jgi:hypothetical protein
MLVQKLAVCAAVLTFGAGPLGATEVFVTSSASDLFSQPGLAFTSLSFNSLEGSSFDSTTISGVVFSSGGASPSLQAIPNPGGSWPAGTVLRRVLGGGEINISVPTGARAFGASFGVVANPFEVTIEYQSGTTHMHLLNVTSTTTPLYLGFVTDAPIANLRFIAGFFNSNIAMNNAALGTPDGGGGGGEAPESGTMLLIGAGLVSLRLLRRWRRGSLAAR